MSHQRGWVLALLFMAGLAGPLQGQGSAYSVQGIGFPQRGLGIIARALGGGPGAVDPESPLNPAAASLFDNVSVSVMSATDFRNVRTGTATTGGLRGTRFPQALVGGRLPNTPFSLAVGFTGYAERSFDLASTDSVTLRGARVGVTDHVASDGGMADLRGALGWTINRHMALGVAGHIISGSAKVSTNRLFSDSSYRVFADTQNQSFSAYAVSAGLLASSGTVFRFGATARVDTRLHSRLPNFEERIKLPVTLAAGAQFLPSAGLQASTTFIWRSWGRASTELTNLGHGRSFDTWEIGAGLQVGASKFPLRLGFRRAQLPFSTLSDQPHETDFSAGTGLRFANGRGRLDVTLERALRDGAGARERAWQLLFGLQVRP